ncbi:hypothetical protein NHP190012_11000 [Helicobacter sp. NHP19-012]|uniref:Methyl-accepting chemotaxis protein n=1 Tax=Helicobacter gastrofelis TaxID=2849642 RepID=A0ABN6I794_9HELI|nr:MULTISPECIES: cache domain-containing protein [unclassified Helicobacter]BCZ19458.1 hypothetical protein NHP190012_11000 [Helicobacter sp. NHP19-012]GMB96448.1 hypothetical protein NHP22001_10370 [Helicobacter sp. NHP22-001]
MSFKTKISLTFAVLLLVSFFTIAGILSYRLYFRMKVSIQQNLQETVDMLSYPLKGWDDAIKDALLKTATQLENMDLHDIRVMSDLLNHVQYGMKKTTLYLGLEDGSTIKPIGTVPHNYDPRTRNWYKDTKVNTNLVMSHPYMDMFSHHLVVTYSIAIHQKGVFKGALGADVPLTYMQDAAVKHSISKKRIYFFDL